MTRSAFGIVNATKNASVAASENVAAMTASRAAPRMRETSVPARMMPVRRASDTSMGYARGRTGAISRPLTAGNVPPMVRPVERPKDVLADRLMALARNLWWSWHPEVASIFRELDPTRWRVLGHNPVALLAEFPTRRLHHRAAERALTGRVNYAYRRMREYLESDQTWAATHAGMLRSRPVAYFSAEFGIHESLPIYSGGLGVLAGDHLKSASDLGVPMVGVGLLYAQGYFLQRVDREGWQQETYLDVDVGRLPFEVATDPEGQPIRIALQTRHSTLHARVWRATVGRNALLLLDTDVEENR